MVLGLPRPILSLVYAPNNVKPEGGGGRGGARGGWGTNGNLTVTYIPRVRILIGNHVDRLGNFAMVNILENM